MENMTDYQYMWMMYLAGATGCTLATWLLFRRAARAYVHFFVLTVIVLLFTPYAVDADKMIMAPAIYSLVFGFLTEGFVAVKPVIKLMLSLWLGALILSLIYQVLTRNRVAVRPPEPLYRQDASAQEDSGRHESYSSKRVSTRHLSREERQARDELLRGEEPIRAIR